MLAFVNVQAYINIMKQGSSIQERLTCNVAGEALLCVEAWQSGLLHRAYPSADVWATKPLLTFQDRFCLIP
jgi:hypothetical protein